MQPGVVVAAVSAVVLSLAGCGGDTSDAADPPAATASAEPTVEPSPTLTPGMEFGSAEQLKDAAVSLGYDCRRWRQDNAVSFAASSGTCSQADVFSVYATAADLDRQVQALRDFGAADFAGILVGPNWMMNIDDPEKYQQTLGGTLLGYG